MLGVAPLEAATIPFPCKYWEQFHNTVIRHGDFLAPLFLLREHNSSLLLLDSSIVEVSSNYLEETKPGVCACAEVVFGSYSSVPVIFCLLLVLAACCSHAAVCTFGLFG